MALRTGEKYIEDINNLHADIWFNGKRIDKDISEHPAFRGVMRTQAKLYDLQHNPQKTSSMTYRSAKTGEAVGASFLEPKTKEDLEKRRVMIQEWAKVNMGMMGRSPDYMNTILMTYNAAAEIFGNKDKQCTNNIRNYYDYCSKNDICMTHTFLTPQVNRSQFGFTKGIAAQMIEKNRDGIVIQGARLLATQGGMTDEIMVFPPGGSSILDPSFAYAFAIPNNTPGLRFICRESFDYGKSHFDHPLSSRCEEMDTIVVFNKVLVPWDRVFVYENTAAIERYYKESSFFSHVIHQVVSRNIIKTSCLLGVIQSIVDTINISTHQHVQEKVAEVIIALEVMKSFITSSETNAKIDCWGTMTPDPNPLYAAMNYFPKVYPRFTEIVQLLGASGLVSIPTELDFDSPLRSDLDLYLQGTTKKAMDRVKLFRLAWDICMSAFGSRQTLYERFFFGDSARLAGKLYTFYDRSDSVKMVEDFLSLES